MHSFTCKATTDYFHSVMTNSNDSIATLNDRCANMFLYIFLKKAFIGASLIIRQSSGILKINLYEINKQSDNKVLLEVLVSGGRIAIGQIVSTGQASAEGFWYEQKQD
jgi:hypothetical protein